MKKLLFILSLICTVNMLNAQEEQMPVETPTPQVPEQQAEKVDTTSQQNIPVSYESTEKSGEKLSDEKVQELILNAPRFASQELAISKSMTVLVQEDELAMSKGANNAITITLPGANAKKAASVWKSYAKSFRAKTKKVKGRNEWLSDDARLPDVSENSIDVYATFDEAGDGSRATVWMDLGGAYLSSREHNSGYGGAVEMLEEYAKEVGKSVAEDQLKQEEKALKALEKEMDRLKRNNETYHRKIDEAKKLIAEMESNIKQNVQDQDKKNAEIETQLDTVKKAEDRVREF